jgi:hypothetical protein
MANFKPSSSLEVPGIEAILEYGDASTVRDDRIPGAMLINDQSSIDLVRLRQIDGLHDDPEAAEARQGNSDRHGERAGNLFYRGRTIGLTGRVEAGNIGAMRSTWRRLRSQFGTREKDLLVHHPYEVRSLVNEIPYPSARVDEPIGDATLWNNYWGADPGASSISTPGAITYVTVGIVRALSQTFSSVTGAGALRTMAKLLDANGLPMYSEWDGRDVWITARAYVPTATGTLSSIGIGLVQHIYTAPSTETFTFTATQDLETSPGTGSWKTLSARVPASAIAALTTHVTPYLVINAGGVGTFTLRFFDCAMVLLDPEAATPSAYFDGSTPGFVWDGAPNASSSRGPTHARNKISDPRFEERDSAGLLERWASLSTGGATTFSTLPSYSRRWSGDHVDGSLYVRATTSSTTSTTYGAQAQDDDGVTNYQRIVEGRIYRFSAKVNAITLPATGSFVASITWLDEAGSTISAVNSAAMVVGENYASVQATAPARTVAARASVGSTGVVTSGAVLEFFLSDPCFVDITDWDPGDFYGAGDQTEEVGRNRRIPRPFLLRGARKTADMKAPEQQSRSRAWRDFTMSIRVADPRVYSLDEHRESARLEDLFETLSGTSFVSAPTSVLLVGSDDFVSTTSGNALNGRTAPLGGSWATFGDATNLTFTDVNSLGNPSELLTRATASDTNGAYGILGATNYINTEVSVAPQWASYPGSGYVRRLGAILRWTDISNHVRAYVEFHTDPVDLETYWTLRIVQVIAGTPTDLVNRAGLVAGIGTGYTLRGVALYTGHVAAQFARNGAPILEVQAHSTALATGGTLQTGRPGIYDYNSSPFASGRFYGTFRVNTNPVGQAFYPDGIPTPPDPSGYDYDGSNLPWLTDWTSDTAPASIFVGGAPPAHPNGGRSIKTWRQASTAITRPASSVIARLWNSAGNIHTTPRVVAGCAPVSWTTSGTDYAGWAITGAVGYSNDVRILIKRVSSTTWLELRWNVLNHQRAVVGGLGSGAPYAFELWASHNTSGTLTTTRLATWDYNGIANQASLNSVPFIAQSEPHYLVAELINNVVIWQLWSEHPGPLAPSDSESIVSSGLYSLPSALQPIVGSGINASVGFGMKIDNATSDTWTHTAFNAPFVHYLEISDASDESSIVEVPVIGDIDTAATIELSGEMLDPTVYLSIPLEDGTSQTSRISLEGEIAANSQIIIDTGEGTIVDEVGNNRYDMLAPGSAIPMLQPGVNKLAIGAADWDDTLAEHISIKWRNALI